MEGQEDRIHRTRPSLKAHTSFNNYPKWKDKLRENCCKRVQEDRTRLLWKTRLRDTKDQPLNHKEFIKSTLQGIVSDELRKIKDLSLEGFLGNSKPDPVTDDALWEYDGLHAAYQGECEEILLEMQRIFYEDLRTVQTGREPVSCMKTWEDEEDEYLSRAVYEHMTLNDEQVQKEVWCPICKRGELQENCSIIYCNLCQLKLNRADEVTLDLLKIRLAEALAEHLERGCKLKPKFGMETRFGLTALYLECNSCNTFEVVI
ncbi:hypothetical protein LguiA_020732 [Lonicera macranthoides]